MLFLFGTLRASIPVAITAIVLAVFPQVCVAEGPRLLPGEPRSPTDHIIGDTIAQGIEVIIKPIHSGLSMVYFRLFEPPMPRSVTTITMHESAAAKQPQAGP